MRENPEGGGNDWSFTLRRTPPSSVIRFQYFFFQKKVLRLLHFDTFLWLIAIKTTVKLLNATKLPNSKFHQFWYFDVYPYIAQLRDPIPIYFFSKKSLMVSPNWKNIFNFVLPRQSRHSTMLANADCYHVPDISVGFDSFGGNSIVNNKETVWKGKYDSRNILNSLYRWFQE